VSRAFLRLLGVIRSARRRRHPMAPTSACRRARARPSVGRVPWSSSPAPSGPGRPGPRSAAIRSAAARVRCGRSGRGRPHRALSRTPGGARRGWCTSLAPGPRPFIGRSRCSARPSARG